MKNIFVDMDGVLAEYRDGCTEVDLMEKGYFASLKPEQNMLGALDLLIENASEMGYNVYVLTKVYPSLFKHSVSEKLQWRDEYMPDLFDSEFIMVDGEKEEKSTAIRNRLGIDIDEDCILVDDYNYNLADWVKNGGTAIKYVNDINDKHHSFIGNRISHTMTSQQIFMSILGLQEPSLVA